MSSSSLQPKPLDELLFDGSVWCNMDVALRNLDQLISAHIRPYNISVIEWYILRALYQQDGVKASKLARAVGRLATSFTPNLDKLQLKGLVERRQDVADRRAILVYLTPKGHALRDLCCIPPVRLISTSRATSRHTNSSFPQRASAPAKFVTARLSAP